jgi:uncharacterized protein (TIGR03067 family)
MGGNLLLLALAVGAPALKEAKPHPLAGTWLFLTRTEDGKTVKVEGSVCRTFTADGRHGDHTLRARPAAWVRYEVDEKARPPAFTVTGQYAEGSPPESFDFLFEIDGDTLTLCTRVRGRPAAIAADAGSGIVVYKLRRVRGQD